MCMRTYKRNCQSMYLAPAPIPAECVDRAEEQLQLVLRPEDADDGLL